MTSEAVDILLSQRFLPEQGGSIRWMYEVYRRWPRPVEVVTHDYAADSCAGGTVVLPAAGQDEGLDSVIEVHRHDILLNDWGLDRPDRLRRYARMTRAVGQRARATLRQGRPVCVHCTHAVPEVVSLLPLKWWYGRRLRIVCYAHGEEITACGTSRQLRWFMRLAHRAVDLMIANSRNTASLLEGYIDPGKVQVIHPGVDCGEFHGAAVAGRRWRAQAGVGDRPVVLTVGRLDRRKNQGAVIDALAALKPRFPDVLYVVAGGGAERAALERRAAQQGVADQVVFAGAVDGETRLALFGGCDLFAMPAIRDGTDMEGFGLVFIEAGACGKAVLAGRDGGQPEAVRDGETGIVVDGTDASAVTSALQRLLGDSALRDRLGRAGRARAHELDWPRVVDRTIEIVDRVA